MLEIRRGPVLHLARLVNFIDGNTEAEDQHVGQYGDQAGTSLKQRGELRLVLGCDGLYGD